ncbi:MAG: membrane or secreted protein [Flavobacteriaceae bacterium]|jgi:hypothetical protein|nr:membrane or secreted protein [Flavobacteriaceae bacterium]|tara:strand:- start:1786 stop:1992 length:207 start_codon:yes stop_codon:yes gene_type:complete
MEIYIITIALLAIAFIGISIKIILKKDGKFSGTCASNNPFLNDESKPCGICGKLPEENECKKSSVNLN